MRLAINGLVAVTAVLMLGSCEADRQPQPPTSPLPVPARSDAVAQRFFAGPALPGEFLTLQSLPPIPASFEEVPQ